MNIYRNQLRFLPKLRVSDSDRTIPEVMARYMKSVSSNSTSQTSSTRRGSKNDVNGFLLPTADAERTQVFALTRREIGRLSRSAKILMLPVHWLIKFSRKLLLRPFKVFRKWSARPTNSVRLSSVLTLDKSNTLNSMSNKNLGWEKANSISFGESKPQKKRSLRYLSIIVSLQVERTCQNLTVSVTSVLESFALHLKVEKFLLSLFPNRNRVGKASDWNIDFNGSITIGMGSRSKFAHPGPLKGVDNTYNYNDYQNSDLHRNWD